MKIHDWPTGPYPKGCSTAEARLRYYASQFPVVEVDSSYCAMPSVDNAVKWVERTAPYNRRFAQGLPFAHSPTIRNPDVDDFQPLRRPS
jgi:hypothetical protein